MLLQSQSCFVSPLATSFHFITFTLSFIHFMINNSNIHLVLVHRSMDHTIVTTLCAPSGHFVASCSYCILWTIYIATTSVIIFALSFTLFLASAFIINHKIFHHSFKMWWQNHCHLCHVPVP